MKGTEKKKIVWVLCWPKGTTQEYKREPEPPKDGDPISASPEEKYQYKHRGRVVWGDVLAVFDAKKAADAYREQNKYYCFTVKRAVLVLP